MLDHAGDDQRLVPPLRQNRLSRAVALSIGLSLVACSSEKADRPSQSAAREFTSVQGRIRLLGEDSASLAAFEKTKTQYETATGISVEIVRRDHADVIADLHGATAAPAYDLLIVPSYLLGELVESEYVQPIDVFLADRSSFDPRLFDPEKDVVPGWWSQLSWYHGHPYGYPFQLRPMSLWYREDLFEDEDESVAFEKQFGHELRGVHPFLVGDEIGGAELVIPAAPPIGRELGDPAEERIGGHDGLSARGRGFGHARSKHDNRGAYDRTDRHAQQPSG